MLHYPLSQPQLGCWAAGRARGTQAGWARGWGRPSQTWVPVQAGLAGFTLAVETLPARELLLLKCLCGVLHPGQRENMLGSPRPAPTTGGGVSGRGRRDRATRPRCPRCPPHVAATSEPEEASELRTGFLPAKPGLAVRILSHFWSSFGGRAVRRALLCPLPQHTNPLATFAGISSASDQGEARFSPNWGTSCGLIPMQVGFRFSYIDAFLSQ